MFLARYIEELRVILGEVRGVCRQVALILEIIYGYFKPTFAQLVRRIVATQVENNREWKAHRYPSAVRVMRWAVTRPERIIFSILLIYETIWILAGTGYLQGFGLINDSDASARDVWTVSISMLGVQAALIGLVFPLIIAFVGLLNQGRASFNSRLTIYIDSTSAIFAGVSSLAFCLMIAIQLPLMEAFVEASVTLTWINLTWFAVNVAALGHFVLRTIAFLHPAKRALIIRSYAANVVWPRELTASVTGNRWDHVAEYGYLPAGDEADPFDARGHAQTWYSPFVDAGDVRVTCHLRRRMRLVDVRVAMLAPVVRAWLADARKLNDGMAHELVVPLQPGSDSEGNQVLARATLPLNTVARWAVRSSVVFAVAPSEIGSISNTSQILHEMIADLIALIDSRQANEFSDQIQEIIAFHVFLYLLAQSSEEDINYSELRSRQRLLSSSIGEDWARAYSDMIARAIERLPVEPEFMRQVANAPVSVYARASIDVTPKALEPILGISEGVAHRLIDWARAERLAEGAEGDQQAFSLSRSGDAYAHAWRAQVASWERLLQAIATRPGRRARGDRDWSELQRLAEVVAAHLRKTTEIAARAIWHGDKVATVWTCDLMLHWPAQSTRAWGAHASRWQVRSEALTLEATRHDWEVVAGLPLTSRGVPLNPSVAFDAIMQNAWRDHALALASICIHWAVQGRSVETAIQAARMLLRHELHDQGDIGVHDLRGASEFDILISALRITGAGTQFDSSSYAGRIDHLLEHLGQLGDAPWVSMRIYSSSGGLSFRELVTAHAIAIIATISRNSSIDSALRRLLTELDDEALRRREVYLQSLLNAIAMLDPNKHRSVVVGLSGSSDIPPFQLQQERAKILIEQSISILRGHRDQAILDAEIDEEKLRELATAIGFELFDRKAFPLNLFGEKMATTGALTSFVASLNNLSKGEFTTPPMAETPVNEEEWWREMISRYVLDVVWRHTLTKVELQQVEGRTPDEFWRAVRDGSKKIRGMGHDPILVVDAADSPQWLYDWQRLSGPNDTHKPADLVITEEQGQAEGYGFTMNSTPVYEASTSSGRAYLLPRELFLRLHYRRGNDGLPVSLRFEPDTANPWSGTMHATIECDVELGDVEGYEIRWRGSPAKSKSVDSIS